MLKMPVHSRSRFDPHVVTIEGEPVRLHFKRMTVPEFEIFHAQFTAFADGRAERRPDPAPPASAQEWLARQSDDLEYRRATAEWLLTVFGSYVTVEPGDFLIDEVAITDGRQFCQQNAGNQDLLSGVLTNLWLENKLTEEQKKTLRSRPGLETGSSTALPPAESGAAPAPAAVIAATNDSAESADVTALSNAESSGMTPVLSSVSALSGS
jgi:hypothetical protein